MPTAARAGVVGAVYFAAALYALMLDDLAGVGALFWPAAGISVAGLLLSPRRTWPAILAAVGVADLTSNLWFGFPVAPSSVWMVANLAEQSLAAWLIQRWRADRLESVRAATMFFIAACAAPVVGAGIGAIGTTLHDSSLPYLEIASRWLVGDALGMLTVVPFALMVFGRLPVGRLRSIEGAAATLVAALAVLLVFGVGARTALLSERYLVLLPVLWAAARLGIGGAAASLFVVTQLTLVLRALGFGALAEIGGVEDHSATQLIVFLVTLTMATLLLATRSSESQTFHDLAAAREQFIAAVSHELRTPLTPIMGFSELLVRDPGRPEHETQQMAEIIHRNGQHLTARVDQLLQVSRERHDALPVAAQVVALRPLLEEVVAQHPDDLVQLDDVPPEAQAVVDRGHLTQILTNLLENALHHGAPPVQVTVNAAEGGTEILVIDHGAGVPSWFTSRLFDEFAQAVAGDRRGTLGLGLGLPISRTLARVNGGELTHRDAGDAGACFVLRLPAPAATTASAASTDDPAEPGA